jgi:hypothetical protein
LCLIPATKVKLPELPGTEVDFLYFPVLCSFRSLWDGLFSDFVADSTVTSSLKARTNSFERRHRRVSAHKRQKKIHFYNAPTVFLFMYSGLAGIGGI